MSAREWCLHAENHTPCPDGYLAWHAWGEKMARTHVQVQCDECGRWSIWKRKARKSRDAGGNPQAQPSAVAV